MFLVLCCIRVFFFLCLFSLARVTSQQCLGPSQVLKCVCCSYETLHVCQVLSKIFVLATYLEWKERTKFFTFVVSRQADRCCLILLFTSTRIDGTLRSFSQLFVSLPSQDSITNGILFEWNWILLRSTIIKLVDRWQ